MKITYPFAAVPNHVCRQGHGAINLAVLTVLLSHGRTTASAATIAAEVGCDRKSVFAAIRYWLEQGPKSGIKIVAASRASKTKTGMPTIYEVHVTRMEDPTPAENGRGGVPKTEHPNKAGCTENGTPRVPKTEHPGVPKTEHKEEHVKKNPKEDITPLPPKGGDEGINRQVAEVMDVFVKTVSPTLSFGHVGQRNAARRVIEAVGFERALNAARFAVTIQGKDFAPTITKPSELENKYGALQGFYRRESERAPQSITI